MTTPPLKLETPAAAPSVQDAGMNMAVMLCNQLHAEIRHHKESYQSKVVYLGWQLTRAKDSLPHGEFGKLFKSNNKCAARCAFDFSRRTAQVYMSTYRRRPAELKRRKLTSELETHLLTYEATPENLASFMGAQYPDFVSLREEQARLAPNQFNVALVVIHTGDTVSILGM